MGPVLHHEQYHDSGLQWPQTQTVIVIASHKQEYRIHAQAVGVVPLPPREEHPNGMQWCLSDAMLSHLSPAEESTFASPVVCVWPSQS